MEFKILSHACLLLQTHNTSIIIDPWLLGSCYWRSWWNFPEPQFDEEEIRNVDAVLISHIHWDHWHGPTLKKLLKGKPVFIPDEPGLRSEQDLHSIGFSKVRRVSHGRPFAVGDIKIWMYQFGLFLNDAAIVIEADGILVLNANDAKIAGLALSDLLSRHGRFDFALRSHSSANSRICYQVEGDENFVADDRDHYFRSFCAFMDAVKPKYAIPFASNHCHLHDDVFNLNGYISNPLQLSEYLNNKEGTHDWELKLMLPGSGYSKEKGFQISGYECYQNLDEELTSYRNRVQHKLDSYTIYENSIKVDDALFLRFLEMCRQASLPKASHGDVCITVRWPNGRGTSRILNIPNLTLTSIEFKLECKPGIPNMIFPAVVFRDAVVKNMFHHAGISKRCKFISNNAVDLYRMQALMALLDGVELGKYPFKLNYAIRLLFTYIGRWREILIYAKAFWLMRVNKTPIYMVEEIILKNTMK